MNKESTKLLKKGMAVTFNWKGVKRTGIFVEMAKDHPNQAVVIWQKDDEVTPSRHWVIFGALHTPEIDRLEAQAEAKAEAERKAKREAQALQKKAEKATAKAVKKAPKVAVKAQKKVANSNKSVDARVKALYALADAIKTCNDLGLDMSKLGL